MKTFKLSISTPMGKSYESESVKQLNCHLLEGRIGVLANHSPIVSSLKVSTFSIELENGDKLEGVVNGGVFNVTSEEVSILTTTFEFKSKVNVEKTKSNILELEKRLKQDLKGAQLKATQELLIYENLKLTL